MIGVAISTRAEAQPDSAVGTASQELLEQQATRFWQTVAAKPEERKALLERNFSAGIRERNGEEQLLETFAMLADVLGSELASMEPAAVTGGEPSGELRYTMADGRRLLLALTLTDAVPPVIDRFAVRPLPPEVAAVRSDQLPAIIGERVNAEFEAGRFSGAVLVARGEELIHAQAIGMADRQSGRSNTLDTPINLGSINKMFTAIAIAQLQAAGKLDWNDTVGRHLPDFPNATIRDRVTIHQLLTHTSGIGSYWNEAYAARRHVIDSHQGFLQTFVDQPLKFEPGDGVEYSNGGPVILGLIIEALSGSDYYEYIREHIYRPAGMTTADHYRRDDLDAGVALGYLRADDGQWKDNRDDLGQRGSAAGGGYASARDLHAFSRALTEERLLPRAQLETLWDIRIQPGPIGYGYLFSVGDTSGRRWVGHNGGAPGISAEFLHYPDDGLVIIVLANQDSAATAMREWLHAQVLASLGENR
ncbi:MAG: serine hydrolase domain-containing protein [Xanthomonadaceae bacterium]|nr:serine hydrolase domain-containing protein [Xanthomonadaceae bacterium]